MPASANRKLDMAARQARAVELSLQGYSTADAAEMLGVSTRTIERDLCDATELIRAACAATVKDQRAEEELHLRMAREEAWQQWHQSKLDAEETITKRDADGVTVTHKRRPQTANPAYLHRIVEISASLARLLNLDVAPEQQVESDESSRTLIATAHSRADAEPGRSGARLYGELDEIPDAPPDGPIAVETVVQEAD